MGPVGTRRWWTGPNEFDLDRAGRDHLAFSAGAHYCVGRPLAKLEATIAVRELVARFPDLRIDGRAERRPGTLIRGLARLPVRTSMARRRTYRDRLNALPVAAEPDCRRRLIDRCRLRGWFAVAVCA